MKQMLMTLADRSFTGLSASDFTGGKHPRFFAVKIPRILHSITPRPLEILICHLFSFILVSVYFLPEKYPIDLTAMSKITTSELSQHNSPRDAWILIDETVWDVTDFADKHPGGAEIIYQYIGHGRCERKILMAKLTTTQ